MDSFVDIPQPAGFRISALFKDNNFKVPVYQRDYSWSNTEIDDFLSDLNDLVIGQQNSHFFGQIVTFRAENDRREIIDGQQRLTTSLIFLAAIRDQANDMMNDNSNDTNINFIKNLVKITGAVDDDIRGDDPNPALIVQRSSDGDEDTEKFFKDLTTNGSQVMNNKSNSIPIKNMQSAYKHMSEWIIKKLKEKKTIGERIEVLHNILKSFADGFYVVMISAPTRQDAFTIFETLNSRGKDLEASDIIKNHLMSISSGNLTEFNDSWRKISNQLNDNSDKITRFIRTYWAAKNKLVNKRKLYRSISDEVKTVNDANTFVEDLDNLVEVYNVLQSPTSPKKNSEYFANQNITQQIDILNRLHVLLYYPVILAMVHINASDDDILKVMHKVISIFIRHRTVLGYGTNILETNFADIAHDIWNYKVQGLDNIIDELDDRLLKHDSEVHAKLLALQKEGGLRGAKKWTLVYLLAELYSNMYSDFDDGYKLYLKVFTDDDYELTHIKETDIDDDYKNYLGNWTIVEKNKNISISDEDDDNTIADKLAQSNLSANKQLSESIRNNGWNLEQIKNRQTEFADNGIIVW